MNAKICTAIREQRRLRFRYNGLTREVAPYCYGVTPQGHEVLRAIQLGGSSRQRGGGYGFGKLWTVSKIEALELTDQAFEPTDPNYNPKDSAMTKILCNIARG